MNASQKSEARKFWKDAYLAAMKEMVTETGWEVAGKKCSDAASRSVVAKTFADEAVKNLKKARPTE